MGSMSEGVQMLIGTMLWAALGGAVWAAVVIAANQLDKWITRRRRAMQR
jgi:cobalamin biosynthesis protein CobD/CbiB